MEHGVPLIRSKWVHRTWAHQEGTQGQGTRLEDWPPSAPRRPYACGIDKQSRESGDPPGPPRPESRRGGPGDTDARQEARLIPGNQPPVRDEDKLASPGWKLVEDLGAKKMEAAKGGRGRKVVSLCPPSLQKVGGLTYPL